MKVTVLKQPFKEVNLRKIVKENWNSFISWIEAAPGGTTGNPDCLMAMDGAIIPVELKVGEVRLNEDCLYIPKMKPEQIAWHYKLFDAGGESLFLVATSENEIYAIHGGVMASIIKDKKIPMSSEFIVRLKPSEIKDLPRIVDKLYMLTDGIKALPFLGGIGYERVVDYMPSETE